jgi:NAD(P)-dependent dehydrogenase (short-subunit alcohol dehydrogenase family)
VITGAAGGVGALLAARFLANGDTVLATDVSAQALGRLEAPDGAPGRLITAAADISSEQDVKRLADLATEPTGRVDVLINCAGFFPIMPFEEMSAGDWQRVIDINLTGTFLMTHAFLPLMQGRGWGRIVNFGSGSVFEGTRGQAHYVAAEAGIVGFSRSLAREVGGDGITVDVITPGLTVTKAVRDSFPAAILQAQRDGRALRRDELPEDLVGPVFFLASPDAGFISGQTLNVDGGNSCHRSVP